MAIGMTLRSARVQRGLSIEQVAQETRISARFLEALEDEAFDELPAPVYVRGFLRSYANYLRVDPAPLLDELASGGTPVAGPDSFVGGPRAQQRPQRGGTNPFQRSAPPPPPAAPPRFEEYEDEDEAAAEESWDPQETPESVRRPLSGRFYENEPTVEPLPAQEETFRPRRVQGVLMERDQAPGDAQAARRVLAMAGGAVIVVLFVLAVAVLFTRGDDGDNTNALAPEATETPTSKPGTVIAVGSATASTTARPSASASATASASPGATASGTPSTATATPPAGTPTATPQAGTPTATATQAAPTATAVPPTPTMTATSTPRPPTPTPVPSHAYQYEECSNGDCGTAPFRVVCAPDGWFVDVGRNFTTAYGWPYHDNVAKLSLAPTACQ